MAKKILEAAYEIQKEYLKMSANFDNLKEAYDRFVEKMDGAVDKMREENEELRRRVTTLEGVVQATFQNSMERAIITVIKEHLEEHGTLEKIKIEDLARRISSDSEAESSSEIK